jgi:hypothetical protein
MAEAFMTCPELAYDFDFFYKLGLGGQSMGLRGSFLTLDLENNSRVLLALVDKVFSNPELETQLSDYRQTAYANAYLALGLLNYGARRFNESRHFLLRAIAIDPRIIIKQQYMTTLAKSLLGSRVVDRFKGMRQPKQIQ